MLIYGTFRIKRFASPLQNLTEKERLRSKYLHICILSNETWPFEKFNMNYVLIPNLPC